MIDIKKDDLVTVKRWNARKTQGSLFGGSTEYVDRSYTGEVLQVITVMAPFVVVDRLRPKSKDRISLNTDELELMKITPEYASAILKEKEAV